MRFLKNRTNAATNYSSKTRRIAQLGEPHTEQERTAARTQGKGKENSESHETTHWTWKERKNEDKR